MKGSMEVRRRLRRLSKPPLLAVLPAVAAACAAGGGAAQAQCRLRLIVGLDQAPNPALVRELAQASGARLDFMSSITPGSLYVVSLSADGPAPNCEEAAKRLRTAAHVQSVELDQGRKHNEPR